MPCLAARPERGAMRPSGICVREGEGGRLGDGGGGRGGKEGGEGEKEGGDRKKRNRYQDLHVPSGTATAISVSTLARPRAGTTTSRALYKSWPAANALPFVGARALSLRNCTCSPVPCVAAIPISTPVSATAAPAEVGAGAPRGCVGCGVSEPVEAMASGVGVEVPESVPWRWALGVGKVSRMTFVRLGSGEEGREGGSWSGAGVEAVSGSMGVAVLLLVVVEGSVMSLRRKMVKGTFGGVGWV